MGLCGTLASKPPQRSTSSTHFSYISIIRHPDTLWSFLSATALLHLAIQRKCIGDGSDTAVFNSISSQFPIVGSERYEGNSDQATLGTADWIFEITSFLLFHTMPGWRTYSFTVPETLRKGEPLPNNIEDFALRSLRLEPPRPTIVADCLPIVCSVTFPANDLLVVNKR